MLIGTLKSLLPQSKSSQFVIIQQFGRSYTTVSPVIVKCNHPSHQSSIFITNYSKSKYSGLFGGTNVTWQKEQNIFIHSSKRHSVTNETGGSLDSAEPKKDDLFFSTPVQCLLTRLTGMNYNRVFRVAKLGQEIKAPTYQFLTEEELRTAEEEAKQRAKKRLQMPPIMNERAQSTKVLDKDPCIQGYDAAKLVFTDITYGIHDRERLIVVREPDGTLREADGTERDRLNQIYFPHPGRKIYTPALFKPENLAEILRPDRYMYILDRNCVQFEPDHPTYIATAKEVYEHVSSHSNYSILWSTRYYGPMIFYLVWEQKCDDLISWYLMEKRNDDGLKDVADIIKVYALSLIHISEPTRPY